MKEYFGLYMGKVTRTDDPEERGRVKAIIPDVLGVDTDSAWCEPCVTVAYDEGGDFCVPPIDEFIWIQFVGGDPNRPVYMGGWWSKNKVPKDSYNELDNYRIINYANCKVTMVNDKIDIDVFDKNTKQKKTSVRLFNNKVELDIAESNTEVIVEDAKVTINGDLYVNGDIYGSNDAHITNTVYADEGQFDTEVRTDKLYANDAEIGNIIAINTDSDKITSRDIEVTGNIDAIVVNASYINGSSVHAGNISLESHTHNATITIEGQTQTITTTTPN